MMIRLRSWAKRFHAHVRQPLAKKVFWLLTLAGFLTIIGFACGLYRHPNTFVSGLFQSWVGDVIFFSVIGALLAIISSFPPALEQFEERANILFQGRRGPQVDYAKHQLAKLGNYSESSTTLIKIEGVDGEWIQLNSRTTMKIRNLIEDVKTIYDLPVVDPEQQNNPLGKIDKIVSFTVDGQERFPLRVLEQGYQGHSFRVEVGGEKAVEVILVRDYWVRNKIDGVAHTPNRFTDSFSLSVVNRSTQKFSLALKNPEQTSVVLEPLSEAIVQIMRGQHADPNNIAYCFYLHRMD
jgi:hypothetical protein